MMNITTAILDAPDTGLSDPNDPLLEFYFRNGWLAGVDAVLALAATDDRIRFERRLLRLSQQSRYLRCRRCVWKPGQQALQRFHRGQMEAVEIACNGVLAANLEFASMGELRELLTAWRDASYRWAVSVELDDVSCRAHAPLFNQVGLTGGDA